MKQDDSQTFFAARRARWATKLALVALSALLVTSCGDDDDDDVPAAAAAPTIPLPAELEFQQLDQEFQQQQQQFGPLCPKSVKIQIQDTGQTTIFDRDDNIVVQGKLADADLAPVAVLANDIIGTQIQPQSECQPVQEPNQDQLATQQTFVTDKEANKDIVAAKKDGVVCDFTAAGKGKDLQQQIQQVVQKGCSGGLQPLPSPTPTASPTPTPSPTVTPLPSPTPTASPTPTPSPTGTPEPTPTPTPTPSPTAGAAGGTAATPTPSPTATPSPTPTPSPTVTPLPSPAPTVVTADAACDAAAQELAGLFQQAKQCTTDADCNYVEGFNVLPRNQAGTTSLTAFECGDATPALIAANGNFVDQNQAELRTAVFTYENACNANEVVSSCGATGQLTDVAPPTCVSGACTIQVGAAPAPSPSPSPAPTASPVESPTPSPAAGLGGTAQADAS